MKNFYTLLFAVLGILFANVTNAQNQRTCASWDKFIELRNSNPKLFEKMQQELERAQTSTRPDNEERAIVTIPVVVHVVYANATQNISDARIQSQIDVLNTDFAGLNSDSTFIPTVFKPLFAKTEIRFCLAQRDPSGNATTGILRVPTTTASFSTNDGVKSSTTGGSNAWDRSKYLNLWSCNMSGGILGYAQFPGGAAATDGVVISYQYFGTTPTGTFNKGRTATHEVGHWLGLYHIWGDDGGACTGSDNIADTPNQADANYGCKTHPYVTCSNVNGDMFMNYMDYGDDRCLVMFSNGQKTAMNNVINGARASLKTSDGCLPVNLPALDASIVSIVTLNNTACGNTIQPVINFKNMGQNAITNAVISYSIDGGTATSYTYSGSIASLASTNITLPTSGIVAVGNHNVVINIVTINGSADGNSTTVNTQSQAFTINSATGQVIAAQGFEAATVPPTGYTIDNPDGATTWAQASVGRNSTKSMYMNFFDYQTNNEIDDLNLPFADLTQYNGAAAMTFDVAYRYYSGTTNTTWDTLQVLISTDCGVTWTSLYKKWYTTLATVTGAQTTAFTPTNTQWRNETIDLTPYVSSNKALIKFRAINNYENNLYLDNINIASTSTVGLNNYDNEKLQLNLFPNPADNSFNLYFQNNKIENSVISIVNSKGQEVFNKRVVTKTDGNLEVIDIANFNAGVYFVKIQTSEAVGIKRLIVE